MCEYCENDKRKKRDYIINTPIVSLKIITNSFNALELKSYNHKKEIVDNYKFINYCPMCGRKLNSQVTIK